VQSVSCEDSDGDAPIPDPDDSGAVQAVSGNGFQTTTTSPDSMHV
jgi:hypothetical protein